MLMAVFKSIVARNVIGDRNQKALLRPFVPREVGWVLRRPRRSFGPFQIGSGLRTRAAEDAFAPVPHMATGRDMIFWHLDL